MSTGITNSDLTSLLSNNSSFSGTADLNSLLSRTNNFDSLLLNGSLDAGAPANQLNAGAPQLQAMLTDGAQALSFSALNRLSPTSSSNSPVSSSSIWMSQMSGLSLLDMASTMAVNVLPFLNVSGTGGLIVRTAPALIGLMQGVFSGTKLLKQSLNQKPAEAKLPETVTKDLEGELEYVDLSQ